MEHRPTYLAVAASAEAPATLPGFIPVRYYKPGRALPNELGVVENCRFLSSFDPELCKEVAKGALIRAFITAAALDGVVYTLEQDQ